MLRPEKDCTEKILPAEQNHHFCTHDWGYQKPIVEIRDLVIGIQLEINPLHASKLKCFKL